MKHTHLFQAQSSKEHRLAFLMNQMPGAENPEPKIEAKTEKPVDVSADSAKRVDDAAKTSKGAADAVAGAENFGVGGDRIKAYSALKTFTDKTKADANASTPLPDSDATNFGVGGDRIKAYAKKKTVDTKTETKPVAEVKGPVVAGGRGAEGPKGITGGMATASGKIEVKATDAPVLTPDEVAAGVFIKGGQKFSRADAAPKTEGSSKDFPVLTAEEEAAGVFIRGGQKFSRADAAPKTEVVTGGGGDWGPVGPDVEKTTGDTVKKTPDGPPKTEGERISRDMKDHMSVLRDKNASADAKFAAIAAVLGSMMEMMGAMKAGTLNKPIEGSADASGGKKVEKGPDGKPVEAKTDTKTETKNESPTATRARLMKEAKPGERLSTLLYRKTSEQQSIKAEIDGAQKNLDEKQKALTAAESAPGGLGALAAAAKVMIPSLQAEIATMKTTIKAQKEQLKKVDTDVKDLKELKDSADDSKSKVQEQFDECKKLFLDKNGNVKDGAQEMMKMLNVELTVDQDYQVQMKASPEAMLKIVDLADKNGVKVSRGMDTDGSITNPDAFKDFMGTLAKAIQGRVDPKVA